MTAKRLDTALKKKREVSDHKKILVKEVLSLRRAVEVLRAEAKVCKEVGSRRKRRVKEVREGAKERRGVEDGRGAKRGSAANTAPSQLVALSTLS